MKGGSTSDCAWKEPMRMPHKHRGTAYGRKGESNHLGGVVHDVFNWGFYD